MKIIQLTLLAVLISTSSVFMGCKKSKENLFTSEYQNIMRENALSEAIVDDALKVVENIMMNNGNAKVAAPGAPLGCITTIDTVVTGATSKTYTINFPVACSSYDGKYRSGTMTVELSGTNYNTTGSSITIHFANFYINSNQFQGKIVSTNLGGGVFKVVVSDEAGGGFASIVLNESGKTSTWKSTHKRTIYEGNGDQIIINNKYHISAYDENIFPFEGTSTDGKGYNGKIKTDLLLDYSCTASGNLRYPIEGEVELNSGSDVRKVNYGSATCDYLVVMNANDQYTEFSLF